MVSWTHELPKPCNLNPTTIACRFESNYHNPHAMKEKECRQPSPCILKGHVIVWQHEFYCANSFPDKHSDLKLPHTHAVDSLNKRTKQVPYVVKWVERLELANLFCKIRTKQIDKL
eukprot:1073058-Amphidinium_carterae.2